MLSFTPPSCRGTGQMSAPQQFTTKEPVTNTSDSKQLAYNGMFDAAHLLVQSSLYLQAGLDPQKSYTLEYVQSLTTPDQLLKVFWGDSPSIVIVGEKAQTEALYSVAEHIAKLLPTLGSLTVVLLADPAGFETANFIMTALAVQKGFRLSAERIWHADRVVSTSLKGKQWIPWSSRFRPPWPSWGHLGCVSMCRQAAIG